MLAQVLFKRFADQACISTKRVLLQRSVADFQRHCISLNADAAASDRVMTEDKGLTLRRAVLVDKQRRLTAAKAKMAQF